MNTRTGIATADLVIRACDLLRPRWTTRVISELSDHGPVPLDQVEATFSDIAEKQLHSALQALRERGLIDYGRDGTRPSYVLTAAGDGLGDVHDTLSRWARTYGFPADRCDFAIRIEATLKLLKDRSLLAIFASTSSGSAPAAPEAERGVERSLTAGGFMYVMRDGEPRLTAAGQALRGPLATVRSWATTHSELLTRRQPGRKPSGGLRE